MLPVVDGSAWRLMHYTTMLGLLMVAPTVVFTGYTSAPRLFPRSHDAVAPRSYVSCPSLRMLIPVPILLVGGVLAVET